MIIFLHDVFLIIICMIIVLEFLPSCRMIIKYFFKKAAVAFMRNLLSVHAFIVHWWHPHKTHLSLLKHAHTEHFVFIKAEYCPWHV